MDEYQHLKVALWLSPKRGSPLYDALQSTIDGLKPLFDGGHSFAPHVTITSNIQIQSKSQVEFILDQAVAAAKSVPYIDIVFSTLTYGSTYFQKVFFKVVESSPLMSLARISREEFVELPKLITSQKNYSALSQHDKDQLHNQAAQVADHWIKTYFHPHLSLVYSNVYPIEDAMQRTIETRLSDVFGPNFNSKGLGWTNGRLSLVLCEGPVDQWQTLGYRDI